MSTRIQIQLYYFVISEGRIGGDWVGVEREVVPTLSFKSLSPVQLFAAHELQDAGLHCLSEFAQIHVHWVGDAIQPSHPLLLPSVFPSITIFSHELFLCIRGWL